MTLQFAVFTLFCFLQSTLSIVVEQWERFETSFPGPSNGNPFVDYQLSAVFTFQGSGDNKPFNVYGFYDGNGIYRIRFMPNQVGNWTYITKSNIKSMDGLKGQFETISASVNNNGPASVNHATNRSFIYANGEPYFQTGTTSYAWIHQHLDIVNNTIKTLRMVTENNIFNKIRMTVFPKWYPYTHQEPIFYPYIGTPPNQWGNFDKFNVSYWQHLDFCLESMLQIERDTGKQLVADLIIFHPYDGGHWGFDCMGCPYPTYGTCHNQPDTYNTSNDVFYIKYLVARVASYRHVWWSMANEFSDVKCKNKSIPQAFPTWDTFFKALVEFDPYRNPQKEKSVHNGPYIYNYSQPWTTHFSVQGYWQNTYEYFNNKYHVQKPVILDEVQYEGNISEGWCALNGPQETDRFWQGNSDGVMVGHSECFLPNKTDNKAGSTVLWWNYGGVLRGGSAERIGWFNRWMTNETLHPMYNEMIDKCLVWNNPGYDCEISQYYKQNEFYIIHWTFFQTNYNKEAMINVTNNDKYELSVIDYYGMKITPTQTVQGPVITFKPPSIPYDIQLLNTNSKYYRK
eukprot:127386_1